MYPIYHLAQNDVIHVAKNDVIHCKWQQNKQKAIKICQIKHCSLWYFFKHSNNVVVFNLP